MTYKNFDEFWDSNLIFEEDHKNYNLIKRVAEEAWNAAIESQKEGADGEWIPWSGGDDYPLNDSVLVDIKLGTGEVYAQEQPSYWDWSHSGDSFDIIAYRVRK